MGEMREGCMQGMEGGRGRGRDGWVEEGGKEGRMERQ